MMRAFRITRNRSLNSVTQNGAGRHTECHRPKRETRAASGPGSNEPVKCSVRLQARALAFEGVGARDEAVLVVCCASRERACGASVVGGEAALRGRIPPSSDIV